MWHAICQFEKSISVSKRISVNAYEAPDDFTKNLGEKIVKSSSAS